MQVIRERPAAARAFPITAPARVAIGAGEAVPAIEWSRLHVLVPAQVAGTPPPAQTSLTLILDFQGYEIAVPAVAERVVEAGDADDVARYEFTDLDARGAELIELFVADIVRGRMSSAGETLLRIDTPVEPISTAPDPKPTTDTPARRSWRPAIMTVFYLMVGIGLFGYVGMLIYANFVRLEVETGVVSRPVTVVPMPHDGLVVDLAAGAETRLAAGALVARLADPELEARIDTKRIELNAAADAAERLAREIEVRSAQLEDYRLISRTERESADAEVAAREEERRTAALAVERARTLVDKGHAPKRDLDDAKAALALAEARLTSAELTVERRGALEVAGRVRHHNGREFVVDLDLLRVEMEEADAAVERASAELAVLLERRAGQEVRAPWGARVVEVMQQPGARLLRGAPLVALERDVPPTVEAFLTQEEVLEIGLGDTADIYLPALDRRVPARVEAVDRTSGFVDEQDSQYTWRGPADRSARVTLVLGPEAVDLPSGLPAVALFHRREPGAVRYAALERGRDLLDQGRDLIGEGRERVGGGVVALAAEWMP